MADGPLSVLDKAAPATILPSAMAVDVVPGSEYAAAVAALCNVTAIILKIFNSPEMLAARERVDVQALLSEDAKLIIQAHKTGDLSKINQESNG